MLKEGVIMKRAISLFMTLILLCGCCIPAVAEGILPGLDNLGSILPELDTAFGNSDFTLEAILNVKPESRREDTDAVTEIYRGIEASDFDRVYSCLVCLGYSVKDIQAQNWKADVRFVSADRAITVSYDLDAKTLRAVFPNDFYELNDSIGTWPGEVTAYSEEIFGVEMPSLSDALNRKPDEVTIDDDGIMRQVYLRFTDSDYAVWNSFLSAAGCAVESYTTKNGVLTINIIISGKIFVFVYDRANNTATMEYPQGTRAQKLYTELIAMPASADTVDGNRIIVTNGANVLSGPDSEDYEILGKAEGDYFYEEEIFISGKTWYKIKYNDGYGYVSSNTSYPANLNGGKLLRIFKDARVRSGPETDHYSLGTAWGYYICVDEVYNDGTTWCKIIYGDRYGYVASTVGEYLEVMP